MMHLYDDNLIDANHEQKFHSGLIGKIILLDLLFLLFFSFNQSGKAAGDDPENPTALLETIQINFNPVSLNASLDYHVHLPIIIKTSPPKDDLIDGWYLMIDDGHIIYRDLVRTYHPFKKHPNNPIIRPDQYWEGNIIQLFGTVVPGFRMWYSSLNDSLGISQILYAESQDGLAWNKPVINNIGTNALFGGVNANLVSVIRIPQYADSPFKFMVYQNGAFNGFSSLDGIQTNPYPENPLFSNGGDVAQFYWDQRSQDYGGTAKETIEIYGIPRRVIRLIRSSDFVHWVIEPELIKPDNYDNQDLPYTIPHFYGMPIFPIGEQYLGLLWILHATDFEGKYGKVNIQLISSHDAKNWIREDGLNRVPILDVGPYGSWDDGQVYSATQPIRVGDELWLYYSGCDQVHGGILQYVNCSIGLATQKYHRLASLDGSGIVLTDNLVPDGQSLHINYDGSLGEVKVEILRVGMVVPGYEAENCFPMSGNSLDQLVVWKDREYLPEGTIQLKFHVENSSLFAFSFGE